jgi:hypothetical protein
MMPKLPLAFGVWQTDVVLFIDFELLSSTPYRSFTTSNPISLIASSHHTMDLEHASPTIQLIHTTNRIAWRNLIHTLGHCI